MTPEQESQQKLENFERAFRGNCAGCRRVCHCGKTFWDSYNEGYSWEDGEREALEANENAVPVPHSVGLVQFEGRDYVDACSCWHERAKVIAGFIDGHAREIAKYLNLERDRKKSIAESAPTVEHPNGQPL